MLKFAVLLAVLVVSIEARDLPFVGRHIRADSSGQQPFRYNMRRGWNYRRPAYLANDSSGQQVAAQNAPGAQNAGAGDDSNDQDAAGGAGGEAAPQVATTAPPGTGDSSSGGSSSAEGAGGAGAGAGAGAGGTTAAPNAPIQSTANQQSTATPAGDNSGDATSAPPPPAQPLIFKAQAGAPSQLQSKPEEVREQESRRASAVVAASTVGLVAGVAATTIVAYKFKDAIKAKVGL